MKAEGGHQAAMPGTTADVAVPTAPVSVSAAAARRIEDRYGELTPRSRAAFERTSPLIPAGVPGGIVQYFPYQIYVKRGDGCHVWDADDRRLVDLVYGDWLYPLGHNHPAVTAALTARLVNGPTFCMPDPDLGYEVASRLLSRFGWLDSVCGAPVPPPSKVKRFTLKTKLRISRMMAPPMPM